MSDPEKKSADYTPGFDDELQMLTFHAILESLIPLDEVEDLKAGVTQLGTEIEILPKEVNLRVYIRREESDDSGQG